LVQWFEYDGGLPHHLANARLRVYLNTGSNEMPMYDGFKYLQADGENASVPST
jgi:hypothetical protein